VAFGVAFGRLPGFIIRRVADALNPRRLLPVPTGNRLIWLPLPRLEDTLWQWLQQDAAVGVQNLNQLLAYTLQFIPVVRASRRWLAAQPAAALLPSVNLLATDPFDWKLLRFNAASLNDHLRNRFLDGLFILPGRKILQRQLNLEPDLTMPAAAACAGFWQLSRRQLPEAVAAFACVRGLPFGECLYQSVLALQAGQAITEWTAISPWAASTAWLEMPGAELLRPQVVDALRQLRQAALEAEVAAASLSRLNRSAALNRATAGLTQLLDDLAETCPQPECPLVQQIAHQWRELLLGAAGEIGQIVITQPVENPFIAGNPVTGSLFVGREETLRRLEELWGNADRAGVPSIVLYGHRRMGKTSILRNLGPRFGWKTVVAVWNMQMLGRATHTGALLYELALTLYDALHPTLAANLAEPTEADFAAQWYVAFNQFLRRLKSVLTGQRVILAIDEFELIEQEIAAGRVEAELLAYLRGVIHSESWFVLALAGLHTLPEMAADYWNPLFASVTPIHVSFLSLAATGQLLANPSDDFPLNFDRDTVQRVYDWVRGQPYLTQLVGHTLVRRYNEQVFEAQQPREPRFTAAEVDAIVMDPAFYEQGSYYFQGVWQQAEAPPTGQTAILRALAAQDAPCPAGVLWQEAGLDAAAGQACLDTLKQHDVLASSATTDGAPLPDIAYDFAVPLMRHWVRRFGAPH
ncbi:MAG: ATP-binding protein, partial [Anaerolineales bacterium]|nr:ATP-binding protein [Anaerolineales bacterium]